MKKHFSRLSLLFLSVALLLPMLFSCAGTGEDDTVPQAATTENIDNTEETTADAFSGVNFGGKTVTFLAWKQGIVEYTGDDAKGDMIESAVFKRNIAVEDKLGVKLDFIIENGNSSSFQEFCQNANNNINSGAQAYDAIACYTRSASLLMVNGSLADLYGVKYLDFDKEWWPASLTELNTIDGQLYFASGDIASSLLYQMMFMAINNDVAAAYGVSGIQELALKGEWTLDKLVEITKDIYEDRSGGALPRDPGNTYGIYVPSHTMLDVFYLGAGLNYVEINSEGDAVISEDFTGETSMDIIDRLKKLFWSGTSSEGFFVNSGGDSGITTGGSMLYVINGQMLQNYMKDAEYDYSILCAPKYNSDQEKYYTAVGFPHSMYAVPIDAANKDMSGAVLELLATYSFRDVTPVIFDTAFKYRYSNGVGDATMFDIIKSGVVFDFGRTMFDQLGGDQSGPIRMWRNEIAQNTATLERLAKSNNKKWTTAL
ncbi:MAG: hypothetical protein MJ137_08015, partial [Clostridia bacterium]|nr:hypothetical protein [Clostridia bacterium]